MVELPGELRGIAAQRVGQSLGIGAKFRLDALLDIGGMAAVYAATHRNGKKVAIKVLHKHYAGMPDVKERFLREGYVANKVDHRGAVQILDDDIAEDGTPFLVMELLLGSSFDKLLRSVGGKLPALEVLALGDQVLDVLDAFHKEAIVHRDIKPANLFVLKQGVVKVLDFGLARVRDRSIAGSPTASGTIIGTASYMAPEQAQGKSDIDARTDIFAVGAVMYEALAGHGVHEGRTPMDRLMSAMRVPPKALSLSAPGLPPKVCDLVDTALRFERQERWPNAQAMRTAIRRASVELKTMPARSLPPPVPVSTSAPGAGDDELLEPSTIVEVSFGTFEALKK
jgi:serine/threonine-protein kinase